MSNYGCDAYPIGTVLIRSPRYLDTIHSSLVDQLGSVQSQIVREGLASTYYAVISRSAGHVDQVLAEIVYTPPMWYKWIGAVIEGYPDDFVIVPGVTRDNIMKNCCQQNRFDLDID